MKRGSTDIDWVIAIVLFIIFLLSIFVFLKPGIIQPHKPESLLDIVEDKLRNETSSEGTGIYYTLYETPLYIENKNNIVGIKCLKIPFNYDWPQEGFDVYKLTGEETNLANLPDPDKQNPVSYLLDGYNIIIKVTLLTTEKDRFAFVYSDNPVFSQRSVKSNILNIDTDCGGTPPTLLIEEIDPLDPSNINFEYNYGVTDHIRGISIYATTRIVNDYNDNDPNKPDKYNNELKPKYGFPLLKEFSIHIKGTTDSTIEYNFQPIQPEVDANVFVREWSDFILETNGIRKPANVNIRIW